MTNDTINEEIIKQVVREVVTKYKIQPQNSKMQDDVEIMVEASGRHVHLSEKDIEKLFGKGYKLTPQKNLSQLGQFACEERVTLIGPKNIYKNVAVLGPAREETQVEISLSDARFLGINAPLRMSGDLSGAADLIIATDKEAIAVKQCAIVAKNHIHMTPAQASQWGFSDGQHVSVLMKTQRPISFNDVIIRVSKTAGLAMHIDFDEANACMFQNGDTGMICASAQAERCIAALKQDNQSDTEAGTVIEKHFITEEEIKRSLKNTSVMKIVASKGSILSAPARDYINKEGITLTFI